MTLQLTAAEARDVAAALHALTAVHEFDGVDAWRAEAGAAVRCAFGGARTLMQLPPCRAADPPDAAATWCFVGDNFAPEIVARCESLFRLGPRSDDPAAADVAGILGACAAMGLDTWTGPSFVAQVAKPRALPFDARRSAFVREIIEPCDMWDGPHLRAHGPGYVAVLGTSAPRLRGMRTESGTLLLASLLQPAFAAGVRAAVTRWGMLASASLPGAPAPPSGREWRPASPTRRAGAHAPRLTARERDVAALLARRATNREIAAALGISPHTARHHTQHVLRKLDLSSRRGSAADRAFDRALDVG
jgi:DNA-binding CsgD family transcriptional regulator